MDRFQIYLIKPTRYDDDGYPLQWWRSIIPSNSLACVAGIVNDALQRGVLQPVLADMPCDVHVMDEIHTHIRTDRIIRDIRRKGGRALIFMVGVQTNQYPRARDLARDFRAAGLPVCIGGFHVSGCISMLKVLPPEFAEAATMGVSLFAGEAEEHRIDEVLIDAVTTGLKPLYNHLKDTPGLDGAPIPLMPTEQLDRNYSRYASFDLGRGCPFECSFCTIINVQGRKSRFRSADDLEEIIRANAAIGVDSFFCTDDNFARNRNWEAFCDRLIALRAEGLKVRLIIQVDTLAHKVDRFIDKCAAAGVDQIFIGLENVNPDNLEAANKKQNRVEDYRDMFLAWKRYPVVITCGYIIGFPNDTYDSVMHDITLLKRELAVDTLYLNYLTPLPGSEDHRRMYLAGEWMDHNLSHYDLNHRVTHHARMSDDEWERAYRDAHASFYTWEHMETVLRRMVALRSNKRRTTVNRLVAYREAVRLEGVAKLESGYFRIKRRRQRDPSLPRQNWLVFYPAYARHLLRAIGGTAYTAWRLRRLLARIMADPARFDYTDAAIAPAVSGAEDTLITDTRWTAWSEKRRNKAAAEVC